MKSIMVFVAVLFSFGAAQADLNGFNTVACKYKLNGATKKPVVTLSTKYYGNNYEPVVTLSVAYVNTQGQKVIENATVVDAGYTEGFEGYYVGAQTTSGKYFEISIYVYDGGDNKGNYSSFITVDGEPQDHMNNLTCKFATAG